MSIKHDLALRFVKQAHARLCVGLAVARWLPDGAALPAALGRCCLPANPTFPERGEPGSCAGDTPLPRLGSSGREGSWRQEAQGLGSVASSPGFLQAFHKQEPLDAAVPNSPLRGYLSRGQQQPPLVQSCSPLVALRLPGCAAGVPKAFCLP